MTGTCKQCASAYNDGSFSLPRWREEGLCLRCQELWETARKATDNPYLMARWVAMKTHRSFRCSGRLTGERDTSVLLYELEMYQHFLDRDPAVARGEGAYLPQLATPGPRRRVGGRR